MTGVRRKRGLRSAVTLAFALGALALSASLALGTYFSARHFLVEQRERTATRQAFADGALVRDSLLTSGAQVSDVLGSISAPAGSFIYVRRHGTWYASSLDGPGPELTTEVQAAVEDGSAGVGWTDATSPHAVVVGIPIPAVDAEYYEVAVADELDRTLRTLAVALGICAALTTIAGAGLGRTASRRVLAPLRDVTSAAVRVSGGDVTTRLKDTDDPDLAALVGAFNNMVDAVHDRIERDARFAADVSHELRTPVTTLTTSLSLLQRATDLSPRSTRAVQLMTDELTRFRRALEDLVALGRLDAGVPEVRPSVLGARDLVSQALQATDRPAALLSYEPARSSDPMIVVERPQMVRALANLFMNADIHGGGLTGVRVVDGGDYVDIQVEDCGPGVPPEERSRIFERFARAGGEKLGTGSGLGLSIVEQTVRNHHGDVWCTERGGGGAAFVVRLPTTTHATGVAP
ncbi:MULTISPECIES: HAMP domain-containing sensor histidine kinase [unclassified Nocardioides]|uniref:HAMP domain-containing sensor histidine kinase n=1 Tax=unclassified Nocardioides TaxID=2615069 RepID=UPI0009EFF291|nr:MULTISPECIES: HAMP domain-containing sensor histidine kinase [unclassified Nocardioides]GAW52250.1 Integral membrane sensor signal transduction his tidine kinase (Precursor) [Nocardioides sp. PD653-B2]GAW56065.1 Integral membrane sensor signal transduction his tidine kinase (Precursor) [Nocardioides sp. PD653]